MEIKELKEILGSEGISRETREAVLEVIGSRSDGELDGEKERAVREILEVELDALDLRAEFSQQIADALDAFAKEGNASAVSQMREESRQLEDRVFRQFKELREFASARLALASSS